MGNIHVIHAADQLHNNREQISSIHAFPDCLWHFIHWGRQLLCVQMDDVYIHIGFTVLKGLGTMLLSIHDDVIKWKLSALLPLCAGNSPVTGEFPAKRPVTQRFCVFFDLRLKKRLSKNRDADDLRCQRAHYYVIVISIVNRIHGRHHQQRSTEYISMYIKCPCTPSVQGCIPPTNRTALCVESLQCIAVPARSIQRI